MMTAENPTDDLKLIATLVALAILSLLEPNAPSMHGASPNLTFAAAVHVE